MMQSLSQCLVVVIIRSSNHRGEVTGLVVGGWLQVEVSNTGTSVAKYGINNTQGLIEHLSGDIRTDGSKRRSLSLQMRGFALTI